MLSVYSHREKLIILKSFRNIAMCCSVKKSVGGGEVGRENEALGRGWWIGRCYEFVIALYPYHI